MAEPQKYEAREVNIQLLIGQVEIPVSSLTMTHTIDTLPFVEVSVQLDNQDARETGVARIGHVAIDLNQFGKLSRALQENILNGFQLEPDMYLTVTDGEGVAMRFVGFAGRPTIRLMEGQLFLSFSGVHRMAALQAFNNQIYTVKDEYSLPFLTGLYHNDLLAVKKDPTVAKLGDLEALAAKMRTTREKSDSIAHRILSVLLGIHNDYLNNRKADTHYVQLTPVFNLNIRALPIVTEFLETSFALTLIEGISNPDFDDSILNLRLYEYLVNSPNFFLSLQAFTSMFLFQMNADWNGTAWIEHLFTTQPHEGRFIKTSLSEFNFNMAHLFELPVLQVGVKAPGTAAYALQGDTGPLGNNTPAAARLDLGASVQEAYSQGKNSLMVLAKYPTEVSSEASGCVYITSAPDWIPDNRYSLQDLKYFKADGTSRFAGAVSAFKTLEERAAKKSAASINILDYLAEQTFRDLQLRGTSAVVGLPLNSKVRAGRTFQVLSLDDELLFSGFLRSIRHQVSLEQGGGSATTSLEFSHVRAPGSKIPSLDSESSS